MSKISIFDQILKKWSKVDNFCHFDKNFKFLLKIKKFDEKSIFGPQKRVFGGPKTTSRTPRFGGVQTPDPGPPRGPDLVWSYSKMTLFADFWKFPYLDRDFSGVSAVYLGPGSQNAAFWGPRAYFFAIFRPLPVFY